MIKVAFPGVKGAFSYEAALKAKPNANYIAYNTFTKVIEAVEKDECKFGLIPFENSYAGRVAEVHNTFPTMSLSIVKEVILPIEHNLFVKNESIKLEDIKEVHSHEQALMQCSNTFKEFNLEEDVAKIKEINTAIAAKKLSNGELDKDCAVVASNLAGETYNLHKLKSGINDVKNNHTTFLLLSKEVNDIDDIEGKDVITSVICNARNIPASIYKILGGFATNGIDLLKLESYIPGGVRSDNAQFFLSFFGHPQQRPVALAMEEMGFFSNNTKILGVYEADRKRFEISAN